MAAQAAKTFRRPTPEADRSGLQASLCEETDATRFLRADLDFHDAIMAASGNRLARAVIHTINTEAFRSIRYIGETTHKDCVDSNVEHRAIYER